MSIILILTILAAAVYGLPRDLHQDGRIIGGVDAQPGEFKSMVALVQGEEETFLCGGSIINTKWILTAAHCLLDSSPYSMTVLAGTIDLKGEARRYGVTKTKIHEEYSTRTKQNDLGLVKVMQEIVFDDLVQPVSLATEELPAGADLLIAGWGFTSWPGSTPNKLHVLKSKVMDHTDCGLRLIWYYPVTDKQICSYTRMGEGMCGGDSGSAVLHSDSQVGVVSWGIPCARGDPDVHTKISAFIDWIQTNTS